MKYILYIIAIICLTACNTDGPAMGPAHNYEVPDYEVPDTLKQN